MIEFRVVDLKMAYIMTLGRPFLKKIRLVESIHYLKLKFRVGGGIGVVRGDRRVARTYFTVSSKRSYCITTQRVEKEYKEDVEQQKLLEMMVKKTRQEEMRQQLSW